MIMKLENNVQLSILKIFGLIKYCRHYLYLPVTAKSFKQYVFLKTCFSGLNSRAK
jgi:hypothetical protein